MWCAGVVAIFLLKLVYAQGNSLRVVPVCTWGKKGNVFAACKMQTCIHGLINPPNVLGITVFLSLGQIRAQAFSVVTCRPSIDDDMLNPLVFLPSYRFHTSDEKSDLRMRKDGRDNAYKWYV